MNVPCDPQAAAGWVFALAAGLTIFLIWLERKLNSKRPPEKQKVVRLVLVPLQLLFIGAAAAVLAQTRFGGSVVNFGRDIVGWVGAATSGTAYGITSGAIALIAVGGLAWWWVKQPKILVAILFGAGLLVLAGVAPWVNSVLDFAINYPIHWVSSAVGWLTERSVS